MIGGETKEASIFLDPFAAEGEQFYDPTAQLEATFARYQEGKINDAPGALDRLVTEIESSILDMHFLGMFAEMQQIAAQAHAMCGEDHAAAQWLGASSYLSSIFGSEQTGGEHDHEHPDNHEDEEDDDEEDGKKGKHPKTSHRHMGQLMLRHKH